MVSSYRLKDMNNNKIYIAVFSAIMLLAGVGQVLAKKNEGRKYTVTSEVVLNTCEENTPARHNGIWMVEIFRKKGRIILPENRSISLKFERKKKHFISTELYQEEAQFGLFGFLCRNELSRNFTRVAVDENELNAVEEIIVNPMLGEKTCINVNILPCVFKIKYDGVLVDTYTNVSGSFEEN